MTGVSSRKDSAHFLCWAESEGRQESQGLYQPMPRTVAISESNGIRFEARCGCTWWLFRAAIDVDYVVPLRWHAGQLWDCLHRLRQWKHERPKTRTDIGVVLDHVCQPHLQT